MISLKIYRQGEDLMVGACDEEILGKKFNDGKFKIHVKKKFYDGQRINRKVLKKYLQKATVANLVGKKTVESAIQQGVIDPECVVEIEGIPHAQMVKML